MKVQIQKAIRLQNKRMWKDRFWLHQHTKIGELTATCKKNSDEEWKRRIKRERKRGIRKDEWRKDEEDEKRQNAKTPSPRFSFLAVRCRRDGNWRCNVECRVLYIGGPECAKITLQKSGSRGHSPTTPSITRCLVYPRARQSAFNRRRPDRRRRRRRRRHRLSLIHTAECCVRAFLHPYIVKAESNSVLSLSANAVVPLPLVQRSKDTLRWSLTLTVQVLYSGRSDSRKRGTFDCRFAWSWAWHVLDFTFTIYFYTSFSLAL